MNKKIPFLAAVLCAALLCSGCADWLNDKFDLVNSITGQNNDDAISWTYYADEGLLAVSPATSLLTSATTSAPFSMDMVSDSRFDTDDVTSVELGSGFKELEDNAFQNNRVVTQVVLPATLTTIGSCAFQNCIYISSISIPSSVTEIGSNAFSGWTSAQTINLGWSSGASGAATIDTNETGATIKYQ